MGAAIEAYAAEVAVGTFPGPEQSVDDGRGDARRGPRRSGDSAAPDRGRQRLSRSRSTATSSHRPVRVVRSRPELRAARAELAGPVGLVPTMGALHEGHASLVEMAHADCASVAVSLFVNPTQFGPNEDFGRYPRDERRDLALLESFGVDLVFVPSVEEMYPAGATTAVDVGRLGEMLEGASRPGHFRGVATVVNILFNLVQPNRAYFGQKDGQQAVVVRRMVRDLGLPVEVVVGPTVREADGLALSSRNRYLAPEDRAQAPALYRSAAVRCSGRRNGRTRRPTACAI